jgi:citrate lyase subunit beta/citryl-CoA lyase
VALAARLTGTVAIDQVVTALQDEERFAADAAVGRALGYRGKLCIHPDQVAWAHTAFSPTPEEVDRARRLLAAQMIDEPLARQARGILED